MAAKTIRFTTVIRKFGEMGEKTGWTYMHIPAALAEQLNPGVRVAFRVKGSLDQYKISQVSLLPMGEGDFIMPINAKMRKAIGKRAGHSLEVVLQVDNSNFVMSEDFMQCLADEPAALAYFNSLPGSHQRYFSKWIDSAKTEDTKAKRILRAVHALARKMGYAEMIRERTG